ncbi:MAG TPA: sugar-binding domain-containing protein [Bacillales bacterium]|nr:sugar-binding domain-containing protein [Bacillales bacterium]
MDHVMALQKKLLPDLLAVMTKRYRILQYLRLMGPIGRRSLSASLGMTERVLRGEVEFLSKQGLTITTGQGMMLTPEGEKLLDGLEETMKQVSGLSDLEQALRRRLNVREAIVVPGDSDREPWVKKDLGRACAALLGRALREENVIAVAGGTTVAEVAELMRPVRGKRTLFVPARGGLGERVENQANSICARMAEKAEGSYRLLHVPDQLSNGTYETLVEEPGVKEVLALIRSADVVIHGIGEALTMAKRRKSSPELLRKLEVEGAVAEAFGYYFDSGGNVVHKVKTIGLQLEDLQAKKTVISVAGGSSKAEAIAAFFEKSPPSVLVTDEGAASALVSRSVEK